MTPPRRLFGIYVMTALLAGVYGCERARAQTPVGAASATLATTPKYRVSLDTTGMDDPLQNRVRSGISRELRKLGDVEVSDIAPLFTLQILGMTGQLKDGTETGYILAVAATRQAAVSPGSPNIPDDVYLSWQFLFSKKPLEYLELRVYSGPNDRIEEVCKDIVADFDSDVLDLTREFRNHFANARTAQ